MLAVGGPGGGDETGCVNILVGIGGRGVVGGKVEVEMKVAIELTNTRGRDSGVAR